MLRGYQQPPEKKHRNKERNDPAIVLYNFESETLAEEAAQKAAIHLREGIGIAEWGDAPNAALHSAYYAMHFCAVAALYKSGGIGKRKDVAQSHEHVIRHYIALAESIEDGFIKTSGILLNRARDDRMRADYFVGMQGASREEARETAEIAKQFLEAWARRWKAL